MMQVNIPEKNYWIGQMDERWFAPETIEVWLKAEGLYPEFCGSLSSGRRQNVEMTYIVRKASSEQALLFKLHFPDCKIHYCAVESSNV